MYLTSVGVWDYFDKFVCNAMVENGKPAPDIFLKACEKLAVNTNEAIVLEDSESGIQAGYSANISVWNSVTAGSNQNLTVQVLQDSTDFRVTAYADGVELKNLEGSTIPVAMEVAPQDGWNQNDLFVVFRDKNGKLVAVKARYNSATGMLMFDAPMLGKFQLVSFPWNGTDYESDTFLAALDDYMN